MKRVMFENRKGWKWVGILLSKNKYCEIYSDRIKEQHQYKGLHYSSNPKPNDHFGNIIEYYFPTRRFVIELYDLRHKEEI